MSPDKYITKVTGKYALLNVDFECPECKKVIQESIDMRDKPEGYDVNEHEVICPDDQCRYRMERVWRSAPAVFIGGDQSDRRIALMRKSFRQRFTKGPEIDDVRHEKGKLFDYSLRSAAATRIKDEVEK